MPLTLEQAKNLRYRDTLYHMTYKNADGTPERWRVNGKVKRWKRTPDRVQIPVKRGLYQYDYVENYNLENYTLNEAEASGD